MNAGDGPQSKMLSREEIASLLTVANTCAVNDEFNLEDLVSKRLDSRYVAGVSPHWVKVKNRQHRPLLG